MAPAVAVIVFAVAGIAEIVGALAVVIAGAAPRVPPRGLAL